MIISTEEWIKFREDGQKFALEKIEELFLDNDDEVEDAEYSYTKTAHTRKQLEEAGFGWVFNCEGIEVEEVEGEM